MKIKMKNFIKTVAFMLVVGMIISSFSACNSKSSDKRNFRSVKGKVPDSQSIAANDNYELLWDADGKATILNAKDKDCFWSDILYESFLEGSISSSGNSPISITVANTKTLEWDTVSSYSQMESNGNILAKKIENGIRVTYFFDSYKIAIPVEYLLKQDCLNIKIDTSMILEDGTDYKLVSISVAQNLCSVKNSAKDGALFVPAGSGALMKTAENADGAREYIGEVYGRDSARRNPLNLTDNEEIRLPVFGAYGDDKGIMGIIASGAASCWINAKAGDSRLGYSSVGAVFYVRGYDEYSYTYHGKYKGITTRVTEEMSNQKLSINYYPIFGNDANYNGMANKYRTYLIENKMLSAPKQYDVPYAVTLLGGTNITKSIFGIPKKEISVLTTFDQAASIISALDNTVGKKPYVRMYGFSDNGLRSGIIAGGKKYQKIYGNSKSIESLNKLCSDTKIFFDYDIVNFSKSGFGFLLNFDTARTAISYKAEHYPVDPLRVNDKNNVYYTVSRNKLLNASVKARKKAERYGIKSLSFSDLGSNAFSDKGYIAKSGIEEDVTGLIENCKKEKYDVAVADANLYAACSADAIFDVSDCYGDWDALDLSIPFYQMVFHSYKPLFSNSVNLSGNIDLAIAKSVAFGMGIGYTFAYRYEEQSNELNEYKIYGTIFDDNKDSVYDILVNKGYADIYSAVSSAELIEYHIDNGLSTSVFGNGKIVYVNQTNEVLNSPLGELAPYEFRLK